MTNSLSHLHQFILDHYDLQALRALCQDTGLDLDVFSGEGPSSQARQLILQAGRQNKLGQLLTALRQSRPVLFAQAGLSAKAATARSLYAELASFEASNLSSRQHAQTLINYLNRAVTTFEAQMYQLVAQPPAPPPHPYKFLYPFEIKDAHLFFGREATSTALHQKLLQDRLTVLHAPAGAGKTSLLCAGLAPRLLREGRLPFYVRVYDDPLVAIKEAIAPPSLGPWPELLSELSLHQFLGLLCNHRRRQTQELVLILDQFEELFTFWTKRDHRRPFIEALAQCYADQSLPVRVLISIRKDYYSDLAEFQKHIPSILYNQYWLDRMTWREGQAAVIGPVAKLSQPVTYEPALHRALLTDLDKDGMQLPHLQIICTRLYESLTKVETAITLTTYEKLGRSEGILKHYLRDVLERLTSRNKVIAQQILKELVSSQLTKRVLSYETLAARIDTPRADLDETLTRLVEIRLLRRDATAGKIVYELAHEYLIQQIVEWFDRSDMAFKQAQELLTREVAQWRLQGTLIPQDRLALLYEQRERLQELDHETRVYLLRSALQADSAIPEWTRLAGEASETHLLDHLEDPRESVRQAVLRGLGEIWKLPDVSHLGDEHAEVRQEAAERLGKSGDLRAIKPLVGALRDPASSVRQTTVRALSALGTPRTIAIEPLLATLEDEDGGVRQAVVEALGKIGTSRAEKPLQAALHDPDPRVRRAATRSLGAIWNFEELRRLGDEDRYVGWSAARELGDTKDPRAVLPLVAALADEHRGVRRASAEALVKLGQTAIEPLISALQDRDWDVRWGAANALGQIGDLRAVDPLLERLQDEHSDVRQAAAEALVHLGEPAVEQLLAALRDEKGKVPWEATEVLGELGDARAVEPLISALHHRDSEMRRAASEALIQLGEPAVEPLISALKDSHRYLRQEVVGALGQLGDSRAVEPLINVLQDEERDVRRMAIEALEKLGDSRAVEPFITALQDEDKFVRRAATWALGEMEDPRAVASLVAALQDEDRGVRRAATGALVKIGRPAVDPLINTLRHQNGDMRWATTNVLGDIGDPRALEPLVTVLQDKNQLVRRAAAKAMKNIGDSRAVGPLIGALWDPDSDVRWEATGALGELGDPRAVGPLSAALQDADKSVRRAAAAALRKIGTPEALAALQSLPPDEPPSDKSPDSAT